jgi:Zn-dependent protease
MAVAGPIVSFLLAFFFLGLGWLLGKTSAHPSILGVVDEVRSLNLLIGIFNLLPGFPLDGGRILRALLWKCMGSLRRSTWIASNFGKGLSYVFIFFGIFSFLVRGNWLDGLWLTLIAIYLHEVAESSYQQVLFSAQVDTPAVALTDIIRPLHPEQMVPSDISLQHALRIMAHYHFDELYVMDGERMTGVLRRPEILEKIRHLK